MPRLARPFFIPKARGPLSAAGHVAASEPSCVGRQGLKPWDTRLHRSPPEQGGRVRSHGGTWQCRSPPEQGGRVQSHMTRGSAGALPNKEAGFRTTERVAVRLGPYL
jgi:hypothetical protein